MPKIKSKTALRTVPVGTLIEVTHYKWPEKASGLRRIVKVQTNAWAARLVNPTEAQVQAKWADCDLWSYWNKMRCVFDDAGFTCYSGNDTEPLVRYEWREFPAA